MHIRKARERDFKACLDLDHSVVTEYAWRMEEHESEGTITVTFLPVHLPRQIHLSYPRQGKDLVAEWENCDLFLIGIDGGKPAGYVTAIAFPGHGLAWVVDLVVDIRWRRQGVGSQLLREAATWASDQGLRRLVLEVQTRNHPGVCFSRAQGMSFCGFNDHHWRTRDIDLR